MTKDLTALYQLLYNVYIFIGEGKLQPQCAKVIMKKQLRQQIKVQL